MSQDGVALERFQSFDEEKIAKLIGDATLFINRREVILRTA